MHTPTNEELLKAGVHFGHMKKKWNPKMRPYIFMERKGIHIIDLNRTLDCLQEAGQAMQNYARSGKKIMYVATKKQARDIVSSAAQSVNMPFVTDRWLGGMMTNFATVRRSVKKMQNIDRMLNDGSYSNITKKERLTLSRERDKIHKVLGGIADLNRLPGALFVVDIVNEHLAVSEATKLGIPTIGIVDTNSDPRLVDYPIPANDDNSRSIEIITNYLTESVKQGLGERKKAKQDTPAG